MEKSEIVVIPFVAHEADMNRMERTQKRIITIAIIELLVILGMFISIMIYFYLPTEVIEEETTQTVQDIADSKVHQNIGD